MKKDKLFIRIIMSIIGLVILGIGVFFTIKVNLGVDPASTVELGMIKHLGITYGTCTVIYNVVLLSIIFFIDRKYINIASILSIFVVGYTVDIFNLLFVNLNLADSNLIYRILVCLLGCFIVSIGVTVYIFADLGVSATDCVAELISDRTKFSYRSVRIVSDFVLVISGFLLGGIVGIGTLIIAFSLGPFIQFVRKWLLLFLGKILGEKIVDKVNSDNENFEKELIV